jgi:uncharacterized protein (DUF488 family)
MLRRQRTILRVLSADDGTLSATQLQKLLFLLREETFVGRETGFYEFLPYKYGAFSFAAHRETEALTAYGYITSSNSSLGITSLGKKEASQVDTDTARAVQAIVTKYGKGSLRTLLKDVYARYPWYATNSELKDIVPVEAAKSSRAATAVYTIGYEHRSVDGFFDKLLRTGIQQIIDVRANPVSRKYGFAKSTLASLAGKLGISYSHFPTLGISSTKRQDVQTAPQFKQLFRYYEREILPANADAAKKVAELMKGTPSVLVCMEKEAVDCHRSRLATRVADLSRLEIVHL